MTQTVSATTTGHARPGIDRPGTLAAGFALVAGAGLLVNATDVRMGGLFLIGAMLGITLYHASFGFTGTWSRFITQRRGAAIRAQLLMLAVATVLFLPLLADGSPLGRPLVGALGPVGVSVFVGAFVFGLGMQLGGGCGSGTLYTVGGGSRRMLVTLLFFIVGAVIGTLHLPWWLDRPSLGPVSLADELGVAPAIAVQFALLAGLAYATVVLERRRHGRLIGPAGVVGKEIESVGRRLWRGPWPLLWAAVALALLNVLTLLVAGHPWSITFGFGLWGAKALTVLGVDVASWEFWTWSYPARTLARSVLTESTSVMNFGLILGAMLAASLAGTFAPAARVPLRSLMAAVIGGLLMGYGARLAFGCNIGALFGGIASASLHGWLWLIMAFAGNVAGVRLRPYFHLPV